MKRVLAMGIVVLAGCGGGSAQPQPGATASAPDNAAAAAPTPASGASAALPPDTLDRSTSLAGTDTNKDGIRDDINRWIDAQSLNATQQKAVNQLARSLQQMLLVDPGDKAASRTAAERDGNAIDCVYDAFEKASDRPHQIVSHIEAITANTKQRAMQYIKVNAALGGMAFEMPSKPTCD